MERQMGGGGGTVESTNEMENSRLAAELNPWFEDARRSMSLKLCRRARWVPHRSVALNTRVFTAHQSRATASWEK